MPPSRDSDTWGLRHEQALPAGLFKVTPASGPVRTRTALDIPGQANVIYVTPGQTYNIALDADTPIDFQIQTLNQAGEWTGQVWSSNNENPPFTQTPTGLEAIWDFGDGGKVSFSEIIPKYSAIWSAIENFRSISHENDTVIASLAASAGNSNYGPSTWRHDMDRSREINIARLDNISVPRRGDASVAVAWAAVNSGHTNAEEAINSVGQTVLSYAEQASAGLPTPWNFIGEIAAKLASFGLNMIFENCDGPLLASRIYFNGIDLYNQTAAAWSSTTDYPNVESHCGGPGHYNATITIIRTYG